MISLYLLACAGTLFLFASFAHSPTCLATFLSRLHDRRIAAQFEAGRIPKAQAVVGSAWQVYSNEGRAE